MASRSSLLSISLLKHRPVMLCMFSSLNGMLILPNPGVQNLYERVERMGKLEPLFVDITWGAGGSTSELTLELRFFLDLEKFPSNHDIRM